MYTEIGKEGEGENGREEVSERERKEREERKGQKHFRLSALLSRVAFIVDAWFQAQQNLYLNG